MKRIFFLLSLFIFCVSSYAGNPDLFYYVADANNSLYSVDRNTGTRTLIGATGVSSIEAIAFVPIPGANVLYAADAGNFGTLNISTGTFTSLGQIDNGGTANGALGAQTLNDVDGLMLDGRTFKLWATNRRAGVANDLLFQIDRTTGRFVPNAFGAGIDYLEIKGTGILEDIDDMAIDPVTGQMYATSNLNGADDVLIKINKFTGEFTFQATLSVNDMEGLAFNNDGTLYGTRGSGNELYSINTTTGAATLITALTGGDPESLASLVADANTMSGRVFNDANYNGIQDGGEVGVANVRVYLYADNNNDDRVDPEDTRIQTALTDGSGDYTFYFASIGNLVTTTQYSSYPANFALTTDNFEEADFTDNVNFAETNSGNNFGIATGPDCDGDGIPNFYEGGLDSDGDLVPDSCDLDSDNDGIRDNVEGIEDYDDDGIPDYRDRDSDDDGIPDAIEANAGITPAGYSATDGNVSGADSDGNGIIDSRETAAGSGVMVASNPDTDSDGRLDVRDLDSDNDGILDIIEAGGTDADNDGQVDGGSDGNSNGYRDIFESNPLSIPNTDAAYETSNSLTTLPNYIDLDSDGDGIDDTREGYSTLGYGYPTLTIDSDEDGIIDFWDVSTLKTPISPYDKDGDGTPDYIDTDSDNDGISDLIEGNDFDSDGSADFPLTGTDANNNGIDDNYDGNNCGGTTASITSTSYGEERDDNGSVSTSSSDLELTYEQDNSRSQTVAVRFTNVALAANANVSSAYIQFEVDETTSGEVTILIEGDSSNNSAAITTTANSISTRARTKRRFTWEPAAWTSVGDMRSAQKTVDVSDILEEIVSIAGWSSGNAVTFIFSGTGTNTRIAENDPVLYYTSSTSQCGSIAPIQDYDGDGERDWRDTDDDGDGIPTISEPTDADGSGTVDYLESDATTCGVGFIPTYAEFESETNNVFDELEAEGEPDGLYARIYNNNEQLILDFGEIFTAGTQYEITWRRRNTVTSGTAIIDLSESTLPGSGFTNHPTSPTNTDNVNFSVTTVTSNSDFRYIAFDKGNSSTVDYELDAVAILGAGCKSDNDNDGIADDDDLDDDNDGITDVNEQSCLSYTMDWDDYFNGGDDPTTDAPTQPLDFDNTTLSFAVYNTSSIDDNDIGVQNGRNGWYFLKDRNPINDLTVAVVRFSEPVFNYKTTIVDIDFSSTNFRDNLIFDAYLTDGTIYSLTAADYVLGSANQLVSGNQFRGNGGSGGTEGDISFTVPALIDSVRISYFHDENPFNAGQYAMLISDMAWEVCLRDTDGDGIEDYLDLDSDNDGIPDIVEAGGTDTDNDGKVDNFTDADDDGLSDTYDGDYNSELVPGDFDGDGLPNTLDLDSDNDGLPDIIEAGGTDDDNNGVVDTFTDANSNGWSDINDPGGSGIPLPIPDTDGIGSPNYLDLDSDNDGLADIIESGGTDTDGDGVVDDYLDSDRDGWADINDSDNGGTALPYTDTDNDGFRDDIDLDSDNDGIPDVVEAGGVDSNGDGFLDNTTDLDGDGISDVIETDISVRLGEYGDCSGQELQYDHEIQFQSGTTNATGDVTLTFCLKGDFGGDFEDIILTDEDGGTTEFDRSDSDNPAYGDCGEVEFCITTTITQADWNNWNNDGVVDFTFTPDANVNFCESYSCLGLVTATYPIGTAGTILANADNDGDGIVDRLDLDSDNDGIPDVVEAGGTDVNGDGRVDGYIDTDEDGFNDVVDGDVGNDGTAENSADALLLTGTDTDADGVPNSYPNDDNDGDGIINSLDLDADNDGIPDVVEAGGTDENGDGRADDYADADGDGFNDVVDGDPTNALAVGIDTDGANTSDALIATGADTDNDGAPNARPNGDFDEDNVYNFLDLDADDDGILDVIEAGGTDANRDGQEDAFVDADNDGFNDVVDGDPTNALGLGVDTDGANSANATTKTSSDSDGDGEPDDYPNDDFDDDGLLNYLDIDADNDGIVDNTEGQATTVAGGYIAPANSDADGDGIDDNYDSDDANFGGINSSFVLSDIDNATDPSSPDYLDLDSDDDGDVDELEGHDSDNDGFADSGSPSNTGVSGGTTDVDGDGLLDGFDNNTSSSDPTNGNLLGESHPNLDRASTDERDWREVLDYDLDGITDRDDLDDDNDGIPDAIESDCDFSFTLSQAVSILDRGATYSDLNRDFLFSGSMSITLTFNEPRTIVIENTLGDATTPRSGTVTIDGVVEAYSTAANEYATVSHSPSKSSSYVMTYTAGVVTLTSFVVKDELGNTIASLDFTPVVGAVAAGYTQATDNIGPNAVTASDCFTDTDGDGIANEFDLDSDNDGIPDIVEAGGEDTNGDGKVDDITGTTLNNDTDNDGLDDRYDASNGGTDIVNNDSDGDGIDNFRDLDADNDGIPDVVEAGGTDENGDGRADDYVDTDDDGFNDVLDGDVGNDGTAENSANALTATGEDTDNDGVPNSYPNDDNDGDGILNGFDLDADNDGIPDVIEAGGTDENGDGRADNFADADEDGFNDVVDGDPTNVLAVGSDANGANTSDALILTGEDTDNDGAPNSYPGDDTDDDTVLDFLDLDTDNDGIPDVVEVGGTDENGDGRIDDYTDADGDGFNDVVDGDPTNSLAVGSDANGANYSDALILTGADTDGDGTPNSYPGNDKDGDTVLDFMDLDADNDGIPDVVEVGGTDENGDGRADDYVDADGDGFNDVVDGDPTNALAAGSDANGANTTDALLLTGSDTDSDGRPNSKPNGDFDGDNVYNHLDLDADDDGILDVIEAGGTDGNRDGQQDGGTDNDGDGYDDSVDGDTDNSLAVGVDTDGGEQANALTLTDADADLNGAPDDYPNDDFDNDGLLNYLDIDADNDGIVDNTEGQGTATYIAPDNSDIDGDGIDDAYDADDVNFGGASSSFELSDIDATDDPNSPDYLDLNSDNDSETDAIEGHDTDGDGIADSNSPANTGVSGGATDVDGDGLLDGYDNDLASKDPTNTNLEGTSHPNIDYTFTTERDWRENTDYDDDGIDDFTDIDDDNDGVLDGDEVGGCDTPEALWNLDNSTDDSSGNNHDERSDGNAPGFSTDRIQGTHSASFNGTSNQIRYSQDGGFMESAYTEISLSAWVKPSDVTGDRVVYEEGDGTNGFMLWLDDGIPTITARSGGAGSETSVASTSTLTTNTRWYHLAAIFDNGDITIFVDGVAETTIAGFASIPAHGSDGGLGGDFGGSPNGVTGNYAGLMDGVRYTNSAAWTVDEIGFLCDKDGDGITDRLDLDSDNDGIPDIIEAGGTDTDENGVVDGVFTDVNNNGWASTFDPAEAGGVPLTDGDADGDGLKNRVDLDSDNDGLADIIEAGGDDTDGDGVVDVSTDTDADGWANTFDADNGGVALTVPDTDGDGFANYLDLDSDSDGIIDNIEWQTTANFMEPLNTDADNDGWDDRYDVGVVATISNVDSGTDGIPDYLDQNTDDDAEPDWLEGFDDDEDGDALNDYISRADAYETAAGNPMLYVSGDDADSDGIPDFLEDADSDGIPNFLDPDNVTFYADVDNDGLVNLFDDSDFGTTNFGAANNTVSSLSDNDADNEPDFRDVDNDVTLPIALVSFTVSKVEEQVQLDWTTKTEINNDYFTIERSLDGVNFKPILTEKGAGNSTREIDYRRYDQSPKLGYNYYRLKQTDFNGVSEIFNVEVVYFGSQVEPSDEIRLYPNPTDGKALNLELEKVEAGNCRIEILDDRGRLVKAVKITIDGESKQYRTELLQGLQLASGKYYVKIITKNDSETLPFIVR